MWLRAGFTGIGTIVRVDEIDIAKAVIEFITKIFDDVFE